MAKTEKQQGEYLRVVKNRGATNKPLRILCLNYEYPPMGGGAGNATHQVAREHARNGHNVHIITARLPGQSDVSSEEKLLVYRVFSWRRGIHQAGLVGVISYLLSALPKLRRLARLNDYDVYHFYFGVPTGVLALYVHWALKKPYIVSLRGSDVPGYDNTRWYLRPLHSLLKPVSQLIWSRAASVTAMSNSLKVLAQNTAPHVEVDVIKNGVHPELFACPERSPRLGPIRLVCVCRLVRRKGLEYLIDALRELIEDNVKLEIVGAGEREADVRSQINRLNLDGHVSLAGYVPRENLADHFAAADIFVLPSLAESFGQALLEAMSAGLPIIASRVGGIPEIISHGSGGLLIESGSSDAIVGAVRKLAADPKRRADMGTYNMREVSERFRWPAVAKNYEELYYKAVGSTGENRRTRTYD